MLVDILGHTIGSQSDMRIVGRVGVAESLLAAIRRTPADVVLVHQNVADEREEYASLLRRRPHLKVLANLPVSRS